jgi:hypothetical protein
MVDILLLQTVSIAIASAGVLLAAIYYVLQIRHQTRIRRTELLMRLYSTGTNNEFMDAFWKVMSLQAKDYQDYVKQYGPLSKTDSPMNRAFYTIISYYELVGVLLLRKLIDIFTVYDVWGVNQPTMLWEKIKPIALGVRREVEPAALLGFEYLCVELKRNEPQLKKTLNEALQKIQAPDLAQTSEKRGANVG